MEDRVNQFGYDLIRNDVLKELLGKEHDSILYWVGKTLARKNILSTVEEMIPFFEKAGWGKLSLLQEKKRIAHF